MKLKRLKSGFPAFAVFVISLALYGLVLPSDLSWANYGSDGGDFLAALLTGGIPHPTGYPTYLLAGGLFIQIPFGTPVWRAALLSACSAAAAAALLCAWIQKLLTPSLPHILAAGVAAVVGLSMSISPLLYSQAVIVEVYGLQSLFFALAIWWIDRIQPPQPSGGWLLPAILAFCFGLGMGNHVTGILAFPPILFFLIQSARQRRWKWLLPQLAAICAGLAVYLLLPLRAAQSPPINWGDPQTLDGFLWLVSATPYQGLLFQTQPVQIFERISALARLLIEQFGLFGVLLGVIGVIQKPFIRPALYTSLLWLAFIYIAFAIGYATNDSSAYLIPFFLVWALWIGLGVGATFSYRWRRIPLGWLVFAAFLIPLALQAPATIQQMDPRAHPRAEEYASGYLLAAPPGAILLTSSDLDTFPLWYHHFGLRQRPDARVIVLPLTQFLWYRDTIQHTYPDLVLPSEDLAGESWDQLLSQLNPDRPVCRSRMEPQSAAVVVFECDPD